VPPFLLVLGTIAAAAVVLRARPSIALGVLLTAAFVVPGSLAVPFTNVVYLTIQHVLVMAGLGRLVLGRIDGSLDRVALRRTRVHVVLVVVIIASLVLGVGVTDDGAPLRLAVGRLFDLLDQLAIYVVFLALLRQQPDLRRAVRPAVFAAVVGCLVAGVEYTTKHSLGEFLFSHLPSQQGTPASFPLGMRSGQVRVRAGAEFSLQFAWLVVTMLPMLAAMGLTASRRRGVLAALGIGVGLLAVYGSFTRTALAASIGALVLAALLSRQRAMVLLGAGAALLAGALYAAVPAVSRHLDVGADSGSVEARRLRLAPILDVVSFHPVRGLGLGDLGASGYRVTDNAYLLHYVELGALGVALLVIVLVVALGEAVRALRVSGREQRLLAAAAAAGIVAYVASAATYDAFTLLQGPHLLWFLVALSVAIAERHVSPRPPSDVPLLVASTVTAGLTGLAAGLLLYVLTPVHVGQRYVMTTLPVAVDTRLDDDYVDGERAVTTGCAGLLSLHLPHVRLDCQDPKTAAGMAEVRVAAPNRFALETASTTYVTTLRKTLGMPEARFFPRGPERRGRPSWAGTAPVWGPLAGMALLLLVGIPQRARRPDRDAAQ
jgi:hypothetical protein